MSSIKRIAITSGEPAGIGPELVVKIAQQAFTDQLVFIGDPALLQNTARMLGLTIKTGPFNALRRSASKAGEILVASIPLAQPVNVGELNTGNAQYVIDTLDYACQGCLDGLFDAMVTPPVHKGVINDAGIHFSGHTEFLQQRTGSNEVVMMLATEHLKVALVTTHLALNKVSAAITKPKLRSVLNILISDLQQLFAIDRPNILVCGLNPHAGENGHMGMEEIETITPVLQEFIAAGVTLSGPLPADTLFTEKYLKDADAVLAMYHDQGLPVLKYSGFGKAVNITLGLPIIRTSVDHGTALDIAGEGIANIGSLEVAIYYASKLARQRLTS